eukprot:GILI01022924.1.p3 GENE.GILI01022924.1~~GILI01022924.1.p3  ORF type:complete len:141 (-),score=3.62 GILI01022924.1:361-783(-)
MVSQLFQSPEEILQLDIFVFVSMVPSRPSRNGFLTVVAKQRQKRLQKTIPRCSRIAVTRMYLSHLKAVQTMWTMERKQLIYTITQFDSEFTCTQRLKRHMWKKIQVLMSQWPGRQWTLTHAPHLMTNHLCTAGAFSMSVT